jgi:GNAT superfamily N-acetyltransferase
MPAPQAQVGGVTVRALEPGDGTDALFDLRVRAFGLMAAGGRDHWQAEQEPVIRDRRCLGAFAGRRLVAAARFHDMTQWWNGRAVPMAGVAGVMVAPEERGRGVGRTLVTALLELIAARGYPLSVLFPSTLPIYRSLGWEIAGTSHEAVIAAHALRSLAPADAAVAGGPGPEPADGVRRAGPQDAAEAAEVLGRVHGGARDCGPNVRDEQSLRLALSSESRFGYLAGDGLLLYTWREGHDEVFVQVAAAASAPTTRALWGIVGSHCWIAERVRARVGPADPVWWLAREPVAEIVDHDDWMLRVVDPAAAIAARGFPPAAGFAVQLRIADTARPANSGSWWLKVEGGHGSLVRETEAPVPPTGPIGADADGDGMLTLGARGLAALYAGIPVATLRRAGLAVGGDATSDALLDGSFAATPFMLDRF